MRPGLARSASLRRAWSVLRWTDRPAADQEAFARYAVRTTVRFAWVACLALLCALPVYYLVDLVVLGPGPALLASARWRLGIGALLACGAVGSRWMHATGRYRGAYPLGIAGGTVMCAIIGSSTSPVAPLGSVTTSAYLLLPLFSVPAIAGLQVRVFAVVCPTLGVLGGFLWSNPAHRADPHFGYFLAVMAFGGLMALVMGHALSHVVRNGFLLSRELEGLARSLEARVRDRTRALQDLFDQLDRAKEQERLRIARDMHDELGQFLSASALALDEARARPGTEASVEALGRARATLDQAIVAVRGMLSSLRPRALEESGIVGAFDLLLDQHERRTGTECVWSLELDPAALSSAQAETVFRVLQECLHNAARHAGARRIDVVLAAAPEAFVLEVRDDGVGFSPAERRPGSFGLLGMRERAEALGGTLAVESAPGRGALVRMVLPAHGAPR